jgi:capsule biosynthesis phosphatase
MIHDKKCIVMDVDGTMCAIKKPGEHYLDLRPDARVIQRLKEYRDAGFYIILCTSRNMRTYEANIGLINANTAKLLFNWLERHQIPYDEIHFGKPWAGEGGFYVDDKAIRPGEFVTLGYEEILRLVGTEDPENDTRRQVASVNGYSHHG